MSGPQISVEQQNEVEREKQLARIRDRARVFRDTFSSPQGKLALEALVAKFTYALPARAF